jgi:hypothetical protein
LPDPVFTPRRRDGRSRDPGGFAALAALARTDPASASTKDLAARRITAIPAAKGGTIADITVGDCLELLAGLADGGSSTCGVPKVCLACELRRWPGER